MELRDAAQETSEGHAMTVNGSNTQQDLLARRKALGPAYRLFYEEPVELVRGEGVWLYDASGRRYLDAYNNVPVVGHANPAVVEALTRQASVLNTHTRYLHDGVVRYAERLLALFPSALDTAMFTCTGSEANDLALRIAFEATGRRGVIVTGNAYHGVTMALADVSPSLRPVGAHVRTIPAPCLLEGTPQEVAARFAASVDAAADELEAAGTPVAALMVDTVFASDGLYADPGEALTLAAERVRARGGLFIADEVQGGFARMGINWWAFQRDSVIPDMVSMGKPMGNGHPIGGLVAQSRLVEAFGRECRYFNTFGGNTVSSAVGLAVLDELARMDAPAHVERAGQAMGQALADLTRRHECLGAVRGHGLYWGVDIVSPDGDAAHAARLTQRIVNGLRQSGVLLGTAGRNASTLKIRPPLVFRPEHAAILAAALDEQCRAALR
ncbi:aspartate aminotransferase family protein [Achromobacter denitrificans]|nr:aspartate aminotransferase family protein [Achromobacter denitrificans]MDF3851981.1 aspartate aminotransferase family protein [Achromobacter denitrificans]MDF3861688.1 aspartate aminotransferase family protein [Achromobacter denitrificans]MDF3938491.1 aspartate aminotransferase family protein [Achromobacter denitrificans]RSE89657.1 aspartate aminotransferase family protein [Achromobacter denitrificans]